MASRLYDFYESGRRSCLLETLSLGDPEGAFREPVRGMVEAWLAAMANVAREAGRSRAEARRRAENALVRIQGGLVVARAFGDASAFRRALGTLPALLATDRSLA